MICVHCGATIRFDPKRKKWVSYRTTLRGKIKAEWKCMNDPEYPVRAHCPPEEGRTP